MGKAASRRPAAAPSGPRQRLVELVQGARCSRPHLDAAAVSEELGGLSPAKRHAADLAVDAFHRALGSARDGALSIPASPRRTLVAMSGGVDSAAAAQLALDAGDEVVAVTLELWSDPATDGEQSCCSPQAVVGARALAQGMGIPTSPSTSATASATRWWTTSSTATPPAARPTRACAVTASSASTRCSTWRTRSAQRGSPPATTRIGRDGDGPLVRQAADPARTRATCSRVSRASG